MSTENKPDGEAVLSNGGLCVVAEAEKTMHILGVDYVESEPLPGDHGPLGVCQFCALNFTPGCAIAINGAAQAAFGGDCEARNVIYIPHTDKLGLVGRLRQQFPETPYHRDQLHRDAADEIERLQARIDALMLEHCPDEMTQEQLANWAACQRPCSEATRAAIAKVLPHNAKVCREPQGGESEAPAGYAR